MTFSKLRMAVLAASIALIQTPALAGGTHGNGHGSVDVGRSGTAAEVDRTIRVSMGENFFAPGRIAVMQGETIRFVVTNSGEFVHEFNIGTAEMHEAHGTEMAEMMETGVLLADRIDNDKMMKMGMAHKDASSILLEPGQSGMVIWTFSGDAALEISCNVPGHRESGMMGTVAMKPADLKS